MKNNKKKYPYQICSIKRAKKTLGVDAQLFTPRENEDIPPMEVHSGFSRFVLTLVDKEKNISPTANIPANDVLFVKLQSENAIRELNNASTPNESNGSINDSIAYTQKLFDRNFKGRTPAEILMNNPDDKEKLLGVREWLNDNVAAYPKNQAQIDAIDEAIMLFDMGELGNKTTVVNTSHVFDIYRTDYKFKTKTDDKGNNLIYGISVVCDTSKDYPFIINITNCYAPVQTLSNGQKNIKMNEAVNMMKSSLSMSSSEWYSVISRMSNTLKNFEAINFERAYKESQDLYNQASKNND